MAGSRLSGVDRLRPRRWSFAECLFDEANWSLSVEGRPAPLETKPLELLRELLLRAGRVASKDELLDSLWPDVTVVEASLPTAVYKLRLALRDNRRERSIIETVPGIGYRLAVPVELEYPPAASSGQIGGFAPVSTLPGHEKGETSRILELLKPLSVALGLALAAGAIAFALAPSRQASPAGPPPPISQRDAANALRRLDVGALERMLAAGWNPNTRFDNERNGALNYALNVCEWDRRHDRRKLLLVVRTLLDGGARLDHRNVWGDTAYSIAKAERYCGPQHPVTEMLRTLCYAGYRPPGDRCLASYEIARRPRGHRRPHRLRRSRPGRSVRPIARIRPA